MKKMVKHLLFSLALAVLWIPMGNEILDYLPKRPLHGSFELIEEPEFIWSDWFEGSFQPKKEEWLNQEMPGRDLLVRLRNQYYFSVFQEAKANGVSPGRNGVLLDVEYVAAFYGTDFKGEEFLGDKLRRW